jgi:hypothetical protein
LRRSVGSLAPTKWIILVQEVIGGSNLLIKAGFVIIFNCFCVTVLVFVDVFGVWVNMKIAFANIEAALASLLEIPFYLSYYNMSAWCVSTNQTPE